MYPLFFSFWGKSLLTHSNLYEKVCLTVMLFANWQGGLAGSKSSLAVWGTSWEPNICPSLSVMMGRLPFRCHFCLPVVSLNNLSPVSWRGKLKYLFCTACILSLYSTLMSPLNSSLLLGTQTPKQTPVHLADGHRIGLCPVRHKTCLFYLELPHVWSGSTLIKMRSHACCCGVLSFANVWPTFFCSVFPSLAQESCFSSYPLWGLSIILFFHLYCYL